MLRKLFFCTPALCCTFESICSYNFRLKNVGQWLGVACHWLQRIGAFIIFCRPSRSLYYCLIAMVNKSLSQASTTVQPVFDSFSLVFSALVMSAKLPCNLLTEWVTISSCFWVLQIRQRSLTESSIPRSPMLKSLMPSPSIASFSTRLQNLRVTYTLPQVWGADGNTSIFVSLAEAVVYKLSYVVLAPQQVWFLLLSKHALMISEE